MPRNEDDRYALLKALYDSGATVQHPPPGYRSKNLEDYRSLTDGSLEKAKNAQFYFEDRNLLLEILRQTLFHHKGLDESGDYSLNEWQANRPAMVHWDKFGTDVTFHDVTPRQDYWLPDGNRYDDKTIPFGDLVAAMFAGKPWREDDTFSAEWWKDARIEDRIRRGEAIELDEEGNALEDDELEAKRRRQ